LSEEMIKHRVRMWNATRALGEEPETPKGKRTTCEVRASLRRPKIRGKISFKGEMIQVDNN